MMPLATFLRRMLSRTTGLVKSRFGFAGVAASVALVDAPRVMRANAREHSRRAVDESMNR